jgi:hypothetical protein
LIDVSLLTSAQYNAINQYHAKVADILEPLLKDDEAALKALRSRTKKLDPQLVPTISTLLNKGFISLSSPILIIFIFILNLLF